MKIYVAGKITGEVEYRAKFTAAAGQLENEGHIVINPAVLPGGMAAADYMKICFAMIDVADAVLFLNDYYASDGAMLEWQYCKYVGKQTMFEGESL